MSFGSCVRGPVQPGEQLWGDLAAAPQYLCGDWWNGAKDTCCGAAQEDEKQQVLSNWKKKGLNWRGSDCPPHDDSQATEHGTELFPALEVFKTQTDEALSNPVWSPNWPDFQQEVGLETSQGPFQPELSDDPTWKSPAADSIPFAKLLFYSKCQGTYCIHSSYALSSFPLQPFLHWPSPSSSLFSQHNCISSLHKPPFSP